MKLPDHSAGGAFVGREREMRQLDAALAAAKAGHGQLVLLAGEPGIGKTRIAAELAARAGARGATVCWGRCWEGEGAPAFWPWVQLVRSYVRDRDSVELRADLGRAAAHIARVIPDIGAHLPAADPTPAGGLLDLRPEQERFGFFDGLTCLKALLRRGRRSLRDREVQSLGTAYAAINRSWVTIVRCSTSA